MLPCSAASLASRLSYFTTRRPLFGCCCLLTTGITWGKRQKNIKTKENKQQRLFLSVPFNLLLSALQHCQLSTSAASSSPSFVRLSGLCLPPHQARQLPTTTTSDYCCPRPPTEPQHAFAHDTTLHIKEKKRRKNIVENGVDSIISTGHCWPYGHSIQLS